MPIVVDLIAGDRDIGTNLIMNVNGGIFRHNILFHKLMIWLMVYYRNRG